MKPLIVFLLLAVLAGAFLLAGQPPPAPQSICPIMGGHISKSVYTDYEGQRVYFCCPGCIDKFLAKPKKFLAKMKKAGVVLDKAPTSGPEPR